MFEAVRAVFPAEKPVGIRVSATDWLDGGWTPEETVILARELKKFGCDFMDVTTGGVDPRAKIPMAPGYQVEFGEKVRRETGLPTMSVGLIGSARQAEEYHRLRLLSSPWAAACSTIRASPGTRPRSSAPRRPIRRR